MQMIIDIPEEMYIDIKEEVRTKVNTFEHIPFLHEVISVGTPLPKGHGRLIDTNEITAFRELECNGHNVESLDEFTTIIEADTESEEVDQ